MVESVDERQRGTVMSLTTNNFSLVQFMILKMYQCNSDWMGNVYVLKSDDQIISVFLGQYTWEYKLGGTVWDKISLDISHNSMKLINVANKSHHPQPNAIQLVSAKFNI